jgi:hypothetical protein
MQQNTPRLSRVDILSRIDAIARELESLRRLVVRDFPQPVENFTDSLLGSLGAEPLTDYDYSLDLKRFAS